MKQMMFETPDEDQTGRNVVLLTLAHILPGSIILDLRLPLSAPYNIWDNL